MERVIKNMYMTLVFSVFCGAVFVAQAQTNMEAVVEPCVYVDTPVIAGEVNDTAAVARLQHFLRTYEGFTIEITGEYDVPTEIAVREFQRRYAADILEPWGLTESTGDASVTTLHKINEIYCGAEAFLTSNEEMQIKEIQKKYGVDVEDDISSESTTTTYVQSVVQNQNGRLGGTPIGFINEFSLPILISLFALMIIQTYFMWGFIQRPKMQLFPREIK